MANETERVKMAAISGASHALQFKRINPNASDEEVMQFVASSVEKILEKIDSEIQ